MSGWFESRPRREGTARGFGFARYKNIASFAAVVAEVEVDEEVQLKRVWCAADAGLVIYAGRRAGTSSKAASSWARAS